MGETSLWSFLLHTSFGWEGRSFSLFDGLGWRRGAVAQGVPHFMLWSMRLTTHESGVVRGVVRGSFGGSFGCIFSTCFHLCSLFVPFFYLLSFLSHRLLLLLFSLFPSFTQSYSFSNQTIVAEWLFVMQSSAGRRVVCSARGGLSRACYNGTLYPSNEGNPLVFWWIAVTLLWPGRGDFSASGLSTFKKIALTSALDCRRSGRWFPERGCILEHQIFRFAKMILRDRHSTFYDLASLFRCRRSTLDRWSGKIA